MIILLLLLITIVRKSILLPTWLDSRMKARSLPLKN
jgi:hypothetical protein